MTDCFFSGFIVGSVVGTLFGALCLYIVIAWLFIGG